MGGAYMDVSVVEIVIEEYDVDNVVVVVPPSVVMSCTCAVIVVVALWSMTITLEDNVLS
jgi:hypothetical protein